MKTRAVLVTAAAAIVASVMAAPAFSQVSPPAPPQEVCDAIDTAGSEVKGVEDTASAASGQQPPASPGSNIRSAKYTAGCRFVDPDAGAESGDPPGPATEPAPVGGASVEPVASGPATAPAAAPTEVETLPVTGGVTGALAAVLLALGAASRWLVTRTAG
jgi:hypothetical protein